METDIANGGCNVDKKVTSIQDIFLEGLLYNKLNNMPFFKKLNGKSFIKKK